MLIIIPINGMIPERNPQRTAVCLASIHILCQTHRYIFVLAMVVWFDCFVTKAKINPLKLQNPEENLPDA